MVTWHEVDVTNQFFFPMAWFVYLLNSKRITFDTVKFSNSIQGEFYSQVLSRKDTEEYINADLLILSRNDNGRVKAEIINGDLIIINYDGNGNRVKLPSVTRIDRLPYSCEALIKQNLCHLLKFDRVKISSLRDYSIDELMSDLY